MLQHLPSPVYGNMLTSPLSVPVIWTANPKFSNSKQQAFIISVSIGRELGVTHLGDLAHVMSREADVMSSRAAVTWRSN